MRVRAETRYSGRRGNRRERKETEKRVRAETRDSGRRGNRRE